MEVNSGYKNKVRLGIQLETYFFLRNVCSVQAYAQGTASVPREHGYLNLHLIYSLLEVMKSLVEKEKMG